MRKLSHEEIVNRQAKKLSQPPLPFSVILNNIRSLYNVGSIFRTADGVGVEKIWLCGITGKPPRSQISKTALGAEQRVPWEYREDIGTVINELRWKKYQIVLLEQTAQSVQYHEFKPKFPVCMIIGNEINGVTDQLVSLCDGAIEIEMSGIKNSLNVAVAFGIFVWNHSLNGSVPGPALLCSASLTSSSFSSMPARPRMAFLVLSDPGPGDMWNMERTLLSELKICLGPDLKR